MAAAGAEPGSLGGNTQERLLLGRSLPPLGGSSRCQTRLAGHGPQDSDYCLLSAQEAVRVFRLGRELLATKAVGQPHSLIGTSTGTPRTQGDPGDITAGRMTIFERDTERTRDRA